ADPECRSVERATSGAGGPGTGPALRAPARRGAAGRVGGGEPLPAVSGAQRRAATGVRNIVPGPAAAGVRADKGRGGERVGRAVLVLVLVLVLALVLSPPRARVSWRERWSARDPGWSTCSRRARSRR